MNAPTLSVILPWFKRLRWFENTIHLNRLYFDPRVEVVICMDEPSEEAGLLELIRSLPAVKFRVIVNDFDHPWRPPCKAINVGIRHSHGNYVAIMSPETIVDPPSTQYLFRMADQQTSSKFFFTGTLWHIEPSAQEMHLDHFAFCDMLQYRRSCMVENPVEGYGFLLVPRKVIEYIGGFDESRLFYGGDDDDIRARLRQFGCLEINDPQIRLIHLFHGHTQRNEAREPFGNRLMLGNDYGRSFNRIAYDYHKT